MMPMWVLREPQKGFSALQRAENSSMVSHSGAQRKRGGVSVLFSEPKIPQFLDMLDDLGALRGFSALQRAENSSIGFEATVVVNA